MRTADELTHLGTASPYFYIGDSHAGAIGSHVFKTDDELIATNLISIWRFVASDVLGSDGLVADPLMISLRRAGAFHSSPNFPEVPGLRPVLTTYGSDQRVERLAMIEHANERPYVISVGEIDVRYLLQRLIGDGIDFETPFSTDGLDTLTPYTAPVTLRADKMMGILAEAFAPLFRGLRIMREAGLRSLFLHSLAPPTTIDADTERVLKHPCPAKLRYKLTMFVNYIYDVYCKQNDIGYINMWPKVTTNGILDERYYLDGLHLNIEHSKLSVAEVHHKMRERSA